MCILPLLMLQRIGGWREVADNKRSATLRHVSLSMQSQWGGGGRYIAHHHRALLWKIDAYWTCVVQPSIYLVV